MPETPLFHWSPSRNRSRILKVGLVPNRPCLTSTEFRAPYICFAESPSWAWALSGAFHPDIAEWDLWQTSIDRLVKPRRTPTYDNQHRWHEVRTRERVYKRDLWYVGSRTNA